MVLGRPILVLNKSWNPIDSTSVREAFGNVMSNRATFLLTPDYEVQVDKVTVDRFDLGSWMKLPIAEGEACIRSTQGPIKIPEIMLLSEYSKIPVRKVVFCRRNLWRRDRGVCQYCGKEPSMDEVTMDHIVPRSKGGESVFENCVLSCIECNLRKGNKPLNQTGMRLRRLKKRPNGKMDIVYYNRPKRPQWNPLYSLRRKTFPKSWATFLANFDEALYWEVPLEK